MVAAGAAARRGAARRQPVTADACQAPLESAPCHLYTYIYISRAPSVAWCVQAYSKLLCGAPPCSKWVSAERLSRSRRRCRSDPPRSEIERAREHMQHAHTHNYTNNTFYGSVYLRYTALALSADTIQYKEASVSRSAALRSSSDKVMYDLVIY